MARLRLAHLPLISVLMLTLMSLPATAQSLLPREAGSRVKFNAMIEMPQGYVSGVCVILHDGDLLKGSIFNEFGITAMDFTYNPTKGKVKLLSVLPMLDKWYIKRTLKGDIKKVMQALERGETTYENSRRHIIYQFDPMADDGNLSAPDNDEPNEPIYNEIPQ